jgi:peroxiredoxin
MTENQKLLIPKDDGAADHLKNKTIPDISLPNQEGNFLRLSRIDTFRIILYFFSMTGRPDRPLPDNWNSIPGAKGCTIETCSFRDRYDSLISLNAIPIGISTQSINNNKEMTYRLGIPYDILSDEKLVLKNSLNLPNFMINNQTYLKRLTLIIEKNIIKKVFYPIYPIDKHIKEVEKWLQEN